MLPNFSNLEIILGSTSPRRSQILSDAGFKFQIKSKNIEEEYPNSLFKEEIPLFLANLKAQPLIEYLQDELLITADTIVWLNNEVIGKPKDKIDAYHILTKLSGKTHEVITGVFLYKNGKSSNFFDVTEVTFRNLEEEEIKRYIDQFQPMDKAGAYGIQDWIGLTTVTKINGCYYNVMGLPMPKLYQQLSNISLT
ncbi:MAG: septum formation protein Maf [Cytophagales bacterium]|nr:MAG: septum formation protein Maf [Cytophagales bacterium]